MVKTIVIGAGVIGLSAAYELSKRGEDVLVVDKARPGSGSSHGNAGWITPSLSAPVPAPGLVATSIKWMLKRDSPLYIQPRLDPEFIQWIWKFWRNCRQEPYDIGYAALADFNQQTMSAFDQLRSEGVNFEMHKTGLLYFSQDENELQADWESMRQLEQIGYDMPKLLNGDEVRDLEPGLTKSVIGGFHVEEERHVRPETLVNGLVQKLSQLGVEIRSDVRVIGAQRRGSEIATLETEDGTLKADKFLVAAGAWSGKVMDRFGANVPVEAGKGYSVTVEDPEPAFTHSMYYLEGKTAFTPFDGGYRIAGTMELSGVNLKMRPERVEAIWRNANRLFDYKLSSDLKRAWVGMRPMTPDGLPVIGKMPKTDNLYVASGHAMLGVTLAPVTGIAIADLMHCGESPDISIDAFDPARFNGA